MIVYPALSLEHQRAAIARVINVMNGRVLLALPMGYGKTLVTCACVNHYKGPSLFIVPASKLIDWQNELRTWVGLESQIIKKGTDAIKHENVIVSYAMAKNHDEILSHAWNTVVCDESHQLKEVKSIQTQRIVPILKKAPHVLLLTGTPQLSSPYELYPQISAIANVFGSFDQFTKRYCNGHQDHWGYNYRGMSNVEELREKLAPIMIRDCDVPMMPLPKLIRHVVPIHTRTQSECKQLSEQLWAIEKSMKKAATSKKQYDKNAIGLDMMDAWRSIALIKLPYIVEWLDKILNGEKLAIFCHHHTMMDALRTALTERNIPFLCIDGSVKPEKRQALLDPFRTEGDTTYQVGLLSLTACGAGINLVPDVKRICFTELFWNPSIMQQAEKRIHRIGATGDVNVYYLLVDESAEVNMFQLLIRKDKRNASIFGEERTFDDYIEDDDL
jgi:SWI/SNF-related matrix-associated actin-dependent regulator 1 of chromatin subfamily A